MLDERPVANLPIVSDSRIVAPTRTGNRHAGGGSAQSISSNFARSKHAALLAAAFTSAVRAITVTPRAKASNATATYRLTTPSVPFRAIVVNPALG